MIPIDNLFMLRHNEIINKETKIKIQASNFSKIPVYKVVRNDIIGYIKTKDLLNL
jgi:CBS domain containing-hemolysin-like protein